MRFHVSGNMLRFTDFRDEIEVSGETVEAGMVNLVEECPQLRTVLLDGNGKVRSVHRVFLNGAALSPDQLSQSTGHQDEVSILTALAGG